MTSIEVVDAKNSKTIAHLAKISHSSTVKDVKKQIANNNKNYPIERQSLRVEPRGKSLKDETKIDSLNLSSNGKLYLKDLGPQIGWKTVFLVEYAGPLVVYLWLYSRPWIFYGKIGSETPVSCATNIAAFAWSLHYAKRLLETLFVHRFSHATMPMRNLFKNCSYYWLFAMYVAYHVNHPLYTSPNELQVYAGFIAFLVCELGNLSIHIALRNLRPAGSTVRKIPVATSNPLTKLFNFVSCPNYTYEFGSWAAFTVMTQCLPVGLFALAGLYQMAVWALGKHRAYKKEFSNYPRGRKAILPLIL